MIFHLDFETDKLFYLWIIKSYKRKDYCTFCKIDHVYAKLTHFSFMMTCSCPDPDLCISTQSLNPCVLHHKQNYNKYLSFLMPILTKKPFQISSQVVLEFFLPRFLLHCTERNELRIPTACPNKFWIEFFLKNLKFKISNRETEF